MQEATSLLKPSPSGQPQLIKSTPALIKGGQALNFRKHFFEITVNPKVPPFGASVAATPFYPPKYIYFKKASKAWILITDR